MRLKEHRYVLIAVAAIVAVIVTLFGRFNRFIDGLTVYCNIHLNCPTSEHRHGADDRHPGLRSVVDKVNWQGNSLFQKAEGAQRSPRTMSNNV
jgi:hypothetical protein